MFSLPEYGIWTTAGQNEQIQDVTLGFGETVIGFFSAILSVMECHISKFTHVLYFT